MAIIVSVNEHFQHFVAYLKESYWGDQEQKTQLTRKQFLEAESERMRKATGCY